MKGSGRYMRFGLVFVGCALALQAFGQGHGGDATEIEIAMLPRYCWSQYKANLRPSPEFRIEGCGVGMNHYCPGLIKLMRAQKLVGDRSKGARDQLLARARGDMNYTLKYMKDYPACPIRPDVETTLARTNAMIKAAK